MGGAKITHMNIFLNAVTIMKKYNVCAARNINPCVNNFSIIITNSNNNNNLLITFTQDQIDLISKINFIFVPKKQDVYVHMQPRCWCRTVDGWEKD